MITVEKNNVIHNFRLTTIEHVYEQGLIPYCVNKRIAFSVR